MGSMEKVGAIESVAIHQYSTERLALTGMLHAGHKHQSFPVRLVWSYTGLLSHTSNGDPLVPTTTLVLPASDSLVETDMPNDWYDGIMPWTQNRLMIRSRGESRPWHAMGHAGTGAPFWNLSPTSTFWYHYQRVRFTGAQLLLDTVAREVDATFQRGEHFALGTTFLPTNSDPVLVNVSVDNLHNSNLINRSGVTLVINPDLEWSILPRDMYAYLLVGEAMLKVDGIPILGSWELLEVATLHPPTAPNEEVPLILGRRLLQRAAREWVVNGSGHIAVLWDTPRVEEWSGRQAVEWIAMSMGILLCWTMVYWTKSGADTLRYALDPLLPLKSAYTIQGRTGGQLLLITILSVFAHGLAFWRTVGSHAGDNFDEAITPGLLNFLIMHTVGSAVSLLVLAFGVYIDVNHHHKDKDQRFFVEENGHLILSVAHATASSRALVATAVVLAGSSMDGMLGLFFCHLIFVLFQSLYMTLVVWSRIRQCRHILAALILCLAVPIMNTVSLHLFLTRPLGQLLNTLNGPLIPEGYGLYILAVVFLIVAFFAPLVASTSISTAGNKEQ